MEVDAPDPGLAWGCVREGRYDPSELARAGPSRAVALSEPLLIRVYGMRRSGNHAVIDWLRRNMPGETVFLNDCAAGDPYASFQALETPRGDRHGPAFRDTRWYRQFQEGRDRFHHVVSYEDVAVGADPSGWQGRWRTVVVHRGFLGWLASYYALVAGRQRGTRWGVAEPTEIAPRIAAYAALLAASADASISLERWAHGIDARRAALGALGLAPRDDDAGAQARYGGGSSFRPGPAAPTAVELAGRWHAFAHDDAFEAIARDAARNDAFMAALADVYPKDVARLERLARGGRLRDER